MENSRCEVNSLSQIFRRDDEKFRKGKFDYLPRAQNHFADALVTLSSLLQAEDSMDIKPLGINILEQPSHCIMV